MASTNTLALAVKLLRALDAHQSQGALASQAADCAPIVEALGYYDLADHLRKMAEAAEPTGDGMVRRLVQGGAITDGVRRRDLNGEERVMLAWRGDRGGYGDPDPLTHAEVDLLRRLGLLNDDGTLRRG